MRRRRFLKTAALATAASALPGRVLAQAGPEPLPQLPFTLDLNPGLIGVAVASQSELIERADRFGFESITPFSSELAALTDDELAALSAARRNAGLAWGSTNLPVEFRRDDDTFRSDLAELPRHAEGLRRAGATRMNTWIMPTHPELHYTANLRQHADRLRACGEILDDYGILLGLEYVGPKTLMTRDRFAFIRTLVELQTLLAEINRPNVGYVLDSFHWYCAEDDVSQIRALDPALIASVDLNDASAERSRDQQIDGARHLPLATGVIDLKPFLQALLDIGYRGPVRAEPFNAELNAMDAPAALRATRSALARAFALVG